jgi:hypothetical protein
MMHRVDSKLSGKGRLSDRIALILRFLSQGCRETEFVLFFKRAFGDDIWKMGDGT